MANLDRLIDKFTVNEAPYFLIVDGRNTCIGKNTKHQDITDAAGRLKSFLEELDAESKTVYKIYCYESLPTGKLNDEVKKIVTKGDHDYLLTYSAWTPKERPEPSGDATEARLQWKLDRIRKEEELNAKLERIETLLLKKELEESDETEDEIIEEMQPNNIVGALVGNPAIQTAIANGVISLLGNFLTPAGQPKAVAGIPADDDDERISAAIATLKKHDPELPVHLEKLAVMAETNTSQFLGLLKFL
jgi:hypothetical protein